MKNEQTVHIKIQKYYQESPLTFFFKDLSSVQLTFVLLKEKKMLFKYTQNKNPQKTHLCLFLGAQFKIIAQIFFYIF